VLVFEAVVYETPVQQVGIQLDESLFPRIALEDKAAFCALYEACSSAVFAYALSILRNRADAEDAMQDTFLKIRSAAHLYKPQGKPMAWVFTITRNICLMMYRKKAHVIQMNDEDREPDLGLDQIENVEDRLTLEKAFSVLQEDTCQIIMLHAVSGMKHREIAGLLNMPLSTVLSKYNRGIKKLRKELEGMI
jgi:RNA polymerase sigma-70 factor (ECF subfamily)